MQAYVRQANTKYFFEKSQSRGRFGERLIFLPRGWLIGERKEGGGEGKIKILLLAFPYPPPCPLLPK